MRVRVKESNRYGEHGPGAELELEESIVEAHPWCFELVESEPGAITAADETAKPKGKGK